MWKLIQTEIINIGILTVNIISIIVNVISLILYATFVGCLLISGALVVSLCSAFSSILDFLESKKTLLKFKDASKNEGRSDLTFQSLTDLWKCAK